MACLDRSTTACSWQNRICFEMVPPESCCFEQNSLRFCWSSLSEHGSLSSHWPKSDRLLPVRMIRAMAMVMPVVVRHDMMVRVLVGDGAVTMGVGVDQIHRQEQGIVA